MCALDRAGQEDHVSSRAVLCAGTKVAPNFVAIVHSFSLHAFRTQGATPSASLESLDEELEFFRLHPPHEPVRSTLFKAGCHPANSVARPIVSMLLHIARTESAVGFVDLSGANIVISSSWTRETPPGHGRCIATVFITRRVTPGPSALCAGEPA